jgi:hypothetical protein
MVLLDSTVNNVRNKVPSENIRAGTLLLTVIPRGFYGKLII